MTTSQSTTPTVKKRRLTGTVVRHAMQKTAVVKVERVVIHPLYHKRYSVHKSYKAHDEKDATAVGDVVVIEACRPMSKEKRWRIIEIRKGTV